MQYDIKDLSLADKGILRIEWARNNMPVLALVRERFKKEKPLKGITCACCLHVTTETGVLAEVLKAGGADVFVCASNPLSTQDDVASALVKHSKIPVFAIKGEDKKTYYKHIDSVLAAKPDVTMDDGADLVSTIHRSPASQYPNLVGGTEETTTGVIRLRALQDDGKLRYPIIAVNDAETKHFFDNRYGTGQSTIDGVVRATNKLICGCVFVVCGYGWCSRGIAQRAKGMGANVVITEVEPVKALEAVMDGFRVMPMDEAAKFADIIVTATGNINVIAKKHFPLMKSGVIVANAGHFNVEIDTESLQKMATAQREIKPLVMEYTLPGSKKINVLAEGRLVNLACAEGHPPEVMDMSFANQALSCEHIVKHSRSLEKKVYGVPVEIDKMIAALKLTSLGVKIDVLTAQQRKSLSSWESGT